MVSCVVRSLAGQLCLLLWLLYWSRVSLGNDRDFAVKLCMSCLSCESWLLLKLELVDKKTKDQSLSNELKREE